MNQLRRLRPKDMHAEDLAELFVGDYLDESRVAVKDRGLAVGRERKLGYLDVPARLPGLRFAEPDAGDLRLAVGAVRI